MQVQQTERDSVTCTEEAEIQVKSDLWHIQNDCSEDEKTSVHFKKTKQKKHYGF